MSGPLTSGLWPGNLELLLLSQWTVVQGENSSDDECHHKSLFYAHLNQEFSNRSGSPLKRPNLVSMNVTVGTAAHPVSQWNRPRGRAWTGWRESDWASPQDPRFCWAALGPWVSEFIHVQNRWGTDKTFSGTVSKPTRMTYREKYWRHNAMEFSGMQRTDSWASKCLRNSELSCIQISHAEAKWCCTAHAKGRYKMSDIPGRGVFVQKLWVLMHFESSKSTPTPHHWCSLKPSWQMNCPGCGSLNKEHFVLCFKQCTVHSSTTKWNYNDKNDVNQ